MAGGHGLGLSRPSAGAGAALAAIRAVAARKHCGVGRAVNLGQGDQHGGFNRAKARLGVGPLAQRLKLQRMRRDIGQVQRCQRLDRCGAVIVGRTTNKAEPGQGHHRINARAGGGLEEIVDRRPPIQTASKGGDTGDALRLEPANDRVIMRGVACKDVRAQQEQADGRLCARRARQIGQIGRHPRREVRVI